MKWIYSISIRKLDEEQKFTRIALVDSWDLALQIVETKIAKTPVKWDSLDLDLKINIQCRCEVVENDIVLGPERYWAEVKVTQERVFESIKEVGA